MLCYKIHKTHFRIERSDDYLHAWCHLIFLYNDHTSCASIFIYRQAKIAEQYYWKGMSKDVAEYFSICLVCQRWSKMPKKTADLHFVGVPNRAFAQWGMDLVWARVLQ